MWKVKRMRIERLDANQARVLVPQLATLLQDVVNAGGTVGFLPPVSRQEATAYWLDVAQALETPWRVLLVARDGADLVGADLVGSTQLELSARSNGLHRAEVMKVMVHPSRRSLGIGMQLMHAIEREAEREGRTTLVLDTREGEPSERLYARAGFFRAGSIPNYARSADGSLHATVYMYKLLAEHS
jgi:acetyltransferase